MVVKEKPAIRIRFFGPRADIPQTRIPRFRPPFFETVRPHSDHATPSVIENPKAVITHEFYEKRAQKVLGDEFSEGIAERIEAIKQHRSVFEATLTSLARGARRSAIRTSKLSGDKAPTMRTIKARLRASLMHPKQEFDVTTLSNAGQKAYEKARGVATTVKSEQKERRILRWKDYLINQEAIDTKADEILLRQYKEGVNPQEARGVRTLYPDARIITARGDRVLVPSKLYQKYIDLAQPGLDRHELYITEQLKIQDQNARREEEKAKIRSELYPIRAAQSAAFKKEVEARRAAHPEEVAYFMKIREGFDKSIRTYYQQLGLEPVEPLSRRLAEIALRLRRQTFGVLAKIVLPAAIFLNRKRQESASSLDSHPTSVIYRKAT